LPPAVISSVLSKQQAGRGLSFWPYLNWSRLNVLSFQLATPLCPPSWPAFSSFGTSSICVSSSDRRSLCRSNFSPVRLLISPDVWHIPTTLLVPHSYRRNLFPVGEVSFSFSPAPTSLFCHDSQLPPWPPNLKSDSLWAPDYSPRSPPFLSVRTKFQKVIARNRPRSPPSFYGQKRCGLVFFFRRSCFVAARPSVLFILEVLRSSSIPFVATVRRPLPR